MSTAVYSLYQNMYNINQTKTNYSITNSYSIT